LDLSPTLLPV